MNDSNDVAGVGPDMTPGDLGRVALTADPVVAADQLRQWCGGDGLTRVRVADWLASVGALLADDGWHPADDQWPIVTVNGEPIAGEMDETS